MGLLLSTASAAAAPDVSAPPALPDFSLDALKASADAIKRQAEEEKTNYLDLPAPLRYEDIQRETLMALKPGESAMDQMHHSHLLIITMITPISMQRHLRG